MLLKFKMTSLRLFLQFCLNSNPLKLLFTIVFKLSLSEEITGTPAEKASIIVFGNPSNHVEGKIKALAYLSFLLTNSVFFGHER